eukprot:46358-Amphidinium_carterae.1
MMMTTLFLGGFNEERADDNTSPQQSTKKQICANTLQNTCKITRQTFEVIFRGPMLMNRDILRRKPAGNLRLQKEVIIKVFYVCSCGVVRIDG